ncbi:MAG: hypothetical protein DWC09_02125 [Candidatus Poseidoniales archaeon]|nr:MAG: hypothetical protein DWC09_02125 [Candidatus Poseidoniales archaeon]
MVVEKKNALLSYNSVTLVALLLLSSWSSALVSAEDVSGAIEGEVSWPQSGSVDSGWIELTTTEGNDPSIITQASTDWNLEFAPGAEVSNVSLQVYVNGSDGLAIDSPLLLAPDTGDRLFDFSGYGPLGALNSFDGFNPYADRLAPNSATGAGWTLPSSATVTDLTLEALAPSDPIAFFDVVNISDFHSAQHPDDGQLYLSTGNTVYVLDANNNPEIIDSFTFDEQMGEVVGLEIGPNGNIHIATTSGQFKMISRADGTLQPGLASLGTEGLALFGVFTSGIFAAYNNGSLYQYDPIASEWDLKVSNGYTTTLWFDITEVYDMHEQSDVLYLATNNGVPRYDLNSDAPLEAWGTGFSSTQNVLHSDSITQIETVGSLLLFASSDSGIARFNHNTGVWLSTWDSGNSLPADEIYGMASNSDVVHILSGDELVRYDRSNGAFSTSIALDQINLTESPSLTLIPWSNLGSRSPSSDAHIATNGNGKLILLEADVQSNILDEIIIATGPFDNDINDVLEYNGIVYGAGFYSKVVERFDLSASVWLDPIPINDYVYTLARAGDTILVGTYTDGIYLVENGAVRGNIPAGNEYGQFAGTKSIRDIDSTGDCSTASGCELLFVQPYGVYTATADATTASGPTRIQESFVLNYDVAIYGGVGFIATDEGLQRYDLANNTFLETWGSTSSGRLNYAQVAVIGTTMNMGIEGFGVARKDIVTGQSLSTLDSVTTGITNDNVYSVEASGSDLWIGTDRGAWIWDGTTATKVLEGGFYERPQKFYDFELDGSTMYAGTSIGLCKYGLSGNFVSVSTCTAFTPIGQVTEVAVNSTTIFAGTNTGVYLVDKTTMTVVDTWTTDAESSDAEVVVIDDVAYIGLSGIGVGRWDITNEEWLTTWGDNVLGANGNIQITGMVEDVANRGLWVAGPQFFRLVNTSTGQVSQSLAVNNAHDLTMYGNTLYYHLKDASDNIFSYDIINSTSNAPLDAGTALGNQTGFISSMDINGDTLIASVLIEKNTVGNFGQISTTDVGGLVQYDLANQVWNASVNSSGPIDIVSYFNSSTGHSWVSWGNTGVEVYAPNGTSIGFWENISTVTEIVEYDGSILFATENGVQRFNETSFQWEATWTSGNGLPSSTGNIIYELWTDGSTLAVGISDSNSFIPKYFISFLELDGTWTSYQTGSTNIPRGIPFSMTQCGAYLYAGFWNNNGGLSAFDLSSLTAVRSWGGGSFPTGIENNKVSALACDDDDILYVGYNGKGTFNADLPISRYDTQNGQWLSTITQSANGLTSDVISGDGLYHSDGMLFISTGTFGFSVTSTTSFSYLQTNATFTGQVLDAPLRTAVTSFQSTGGELHLARAGGSTGVNSILKYNASGFDVHIQNAALPSGNTSSIEGDGNTVWVATPGAVLKGEYNASSAIEWMNGWTTPVGAVTTDILLDGTDLYITTTGSGLLKLDTSTGDIISINGAQHDNQAGLAQAIDSSGAEQLIIGLLGSATTSSGVQSFDLGSQQFTLAALLAGLPSNAIQGFTFSSDSLYIATSNGIGQWNFTASAWENPLTIADGFPDSFISDVFWASNTLYAASLSGITQYIPTTGASTTMKQSDGLLGNSVASFGRYTTTNQGIWLIAVHDAALGERPGLSVVDISSNAVVSTHRFDQLPSNTVTSVTADYGGVHIATDIGSLTHYNGLTDQFIAGITSSDVPSWPIRDMESDGVHLIVRGSSSISIVEARNTSHSLLKSFVVPNPQNVAVGPTGFWLASRDDGLFGWNKAFEAIPDGVARTANPLFASIGGQVFSIGEMAHPGYQIKLVSSIDALTLNSSAGVVDGNGVLFQFMPLALSSPNPNASVWAKTVELNYSAEMTIADPANLEEMLQLAIDNGQIINQTRYVPLKLLSAGNGTLEVRLTYDWVRKDTPVVITDAYDRPDDAGGALSFEWSIVPDIDFKAYHVYLNDGPWDELVTDINFEDRIADASESVFTRTVAIATTANGISIVDGTEYYAFVVVEYQDGRYGVPSSIAGPLFTSDEVPTPPVWATAVPYQDGEEGDLSVEWAKCMALDGVQTNIYTSTLPITDAVGLAPIATVQINEGNNTTLSVSTGIPYWMAFTCIDTAGQEDVANATVIGPVIATGGENDGLPPAPLTNVFAIDTPDDSGGRITVGWDVSNSQDCAFYQIFMLTDVEFSFEPTSVGGFTGSKIITDCSTNSTVISDFDGAPLIDGQEYYIGVIAYDVYLNSQRTGVEIVSAVPIDNLNSEVLPPDRISNIEVFDTPNDDGTSIDISWPVSDADDFGYYTVWIADRPLVSVASLWNEYGTNPDLCGCVVIDKQWVDENKEPIDLSANSGLYYASDVSGNTINVSTLIQPNTKLYVTVTVHNSDGVAHLTGLLNPSVTPINNLQDDVAPQRIENLTLEDRPLDDGTGLNLEFELSTESDIFEYQVYAAPFDFTSVGDGSNGPLTPVLITDRAPDFPLSITQLTGDFEVTPQLTVWVAVVPVDFAGNAIMKELTTVSAQSIDDGFINDENDLPSIEGIKASWIDGERILITWNQTEYEQIEGYQVHMSADNFSLIANATLIGDGITTASFIVSNDNFATLTNTSNWYVSVTPYTSENVKQSVKPIRVGAYDVAIAPSEGEESFSIQTLLSTQNFIAAGVVLAVLVLLVTFSRSRKGRSDISKAWDSQASTWGIDEDTQVDGLFSPEIPPPQGFNPGPMPPMGSPMLQQPLPPMPAGLNQPTQLAQPTYGQPQPAQPVQPNYAQPPQSVQPVQPNYAQPPQSIQPVQPNYAQPPQPIQQALPVVQQPIQVQPPNKVDVSFLDELL